MSTFKHALLVMFHPVTAFQYMQKNRDEFHTAPIFILLLFAVCVRIFSIYFTHFPLAGVEVRNANLLWECAKIFVPVITWVLASYAMTTILDGETLLREALLAMAYSLVPYVVFTVPLTLFSRILEQGQGGLFYGIQNFLLVWVFMLLLTNLKEMNHYSFKKTALILLLSVFTMAIMWAAAALFFSISMQFVSFVKEVIIELRYKVS
jgi:hypothetical protein